MADCTISAIIKTSWGLSDYGCMAGLYTLVRLPLTFGVGLVQASCRNRVWEHYTWPNSSVLPTAPCVTWGSKNPKKMTLLHHGWMMFFLEALEQLDEARVAVQVQFLNIIVQQEGNAPIRARTSKIGHPTTTWLFCLIRSTKIICYLVRFSFPEDK